MLEKYHYKFDAPDERDFVFGIGSEGNSLPESVDLRDKFPSPPYNQGKLGSCTANTLVSLREYLLVNEGIPYTPLSRLFIYYFERYLEGTINQDSGASLRDGMRVLHQRGVCPELDYEYLIDRFKIRPSIQAIENAKKFKINSYHSVSSVYELQTALANGFPVAIGFMVSESFESSEVAKTAIVPLPKPNERIIGGHAVLVVGYAQVNGKLHFIIRNSWGTEWGDNGHCYMPVDFFEQGIVVDMWTGQ